jgi:hypothetical protein
LSPATCAAATKLVFLSYNFREILEAAEPTVAFFAGILPLPHRIVAPKPRGWKFSLGNALLASDCFFEHLKGSNFATT